MSTHNVCFHGHRKNITVNVLKFRTSKCDKMIYANSEGLDMTAP